MASLVLGEGFGLDDGVEKLTAGAKFHDQFEFGRGLVNLVQVNDVGVIHGGHGDQLGLEFLRVADLVGLDDLHGNLRVGQFSVTFAHPELDRTVSTGSVIDNERKNIKSLIKIVVDV